MNFKLKKLWADKALGWTEESIKKHLKEFFKQGVYEYSDWIVTFSDGSKKPMARYWFSYWEELKPLTLPVGLYEAPT